MKPFWPVDKSFPITQIFGANPASYPKRQGHPGTDFGLPVGNKEYAVWDAKVKFAGYRETSGYGREVDLLVNNRWLVIYGHLHELDVMTGDTIKRGEVIGLSGGDPTDNDPIDGMSSGAHLHFEVRDLLKPQIYPLIGAVDPEIWLTTDLDTNSDTTAEPDIEHPQTETNKVTVVTDQLSIRRDPSTKKDAIGKVLLGMDFQKAGEVIPGTGKVKGWQPIVVYVATGVEGDGDYLG
jgi:hypothetical protein